jgi:hypothetical protein
MRHTCATCLRPVYQDADGWHHIDSTFDVNPDHAHLCLPYGQPLVVLFDQELVP